MKSYKNFSLLQVIAIATVLISWSSAFVFIRLCLHSFSPGNLALFRYLLVSLVMLIFYCRLKKRTKPTLPQLMQLFFLGFFGFAVYMVALNYGEITVSAGLTSFIIGMNPIVTMILATLFFNEKISMKRWLGVGVSVIGLIIISIAKFNNSSNDWGILILLISVIAAGIYNVSQKPLLKTFRPIEVSAISAWCGTLCMLFFAPSLVHQLPHVSWTAISAVIYLAIVPGAIGYSAWSYAMNAAKSPSKLSLALYTLPLFATLMGWVILNEIPTALELTGGFVALLGALIATRY